MDSAAQFFSSGIISLLLSLWMVRGTEGAAVPVMGAVQASTLLRRAAGLAVDGRRDTCALTGMQEGAWWRADLGAEYNVTAVIIKGRIAAPFEIRVGNTVFETGFLNGFETNALCTYGAEVRWETGPSSQHCVTGYRVGRHVSIMSNKRQAKIIMELCDVQIVAA